MSMIIAKLEFTRGTVQSKKKLMGIQGITKSNVLQLADIGSILLC